MLFEILLAARTLTFTLPTTHVDGTPLSDGYRRWELSYSNQARSWKDNNQAWRDDPANETIWIPQAQRKIVMYGYGRPGTVVFQVEPAIMSLDWPYTWWVRYWTDVPGYWSNPISLPGQ